MADRSTILPASRRVPIARRSGRTAIAIEPPPAGAMPRASTRSGPVRRPVDRPDRAALLPVSVPLLGRGRPPRTRLERLLGGSAVAHAVLIVGLAILFARQAKLKPPQDAPAVEMVYGNSGMVGQPVSPDQAGGGKPQPQQAAPPTPPREPEINTDMSDVPPPVPVPEFSPLPVPPPPPVPPKPQQPESHMSRVPLSVAPRKQARSNPFSHPMDLSFSDAGPPRPRTGRASGSGAPIDMSLGSLVKNGHLNTPYANVGVKGVSDDYGNELDSWIRRHLYYPPDAAQRGEDGPVQVHVQIDRSGHVKSIRLVSSSGSFSLDDSTQGMFRGRSLPPVPPDMQGDHFDIDLTVNYILQR